VHTLVASVLPHGDAQRVNHIHAFYIQYSEQVGQKSLDSHMDDSHWTINLCLSVSDDLRGSELVFDPQLVTCVKRTRAASALCNVFTGTGTAKQGAVSSTAGACATTCSRCSADNARTSSCGLTCCPSSTLPQAAEATMTLEVEGIKHESISLADNHRHMLRHQTRHVPSHACHHTHHERKVRTRCDIMVRHSGQQVTLSARQYRNTSDDVHDTHAMNSNQPPAMHDTKHAGGAAYQRTHCTGTCDRTAPAPR
jgi:hypothetical protein